MCGKSGLRKYQCYIKHKSFLLMISNISFTRSIYYPKLVKVIRCDCKKNLTNIFCPMSWFSMTDTNQYVYLYSYDMFYAYECQ